MTPFRSVVISILGWSVCTISLFTIVGKIITQRLFINWFGDPVGMATNTAVNFFLVGVALILAAWDHS